jgi:hypothetical protein
MYNIIKERMALMKKIGGVNMEAIARLKRTCTKEKNATERYCSVYESLEQSLKEVKQIREGKIKPKTWEELYKELKEEKE